MAKGHTGPKYIIEMHTHVFNAHYLPLKGYLKSYVKSKPIAKAAADFLNLITGVSYADAKDIVPKNTPEARLDRVYINQIWRIAQKTLYDSATENAITAFNQSPTKWRAIAERRLSDDPLFQAIQSIEQLHIDSEGITLRGVPVAKEIFADVSKSDLSPGHSRAVSLAAKIIPKIDSFLPAVRWLLKKMAEAALQTERFRAVGSFLAFIRMMVRSEKSIFEKLIENYPGRDNLLFHVHHMMDMEKAYTPPCKPYYDFHREQAPRMQRLAAESRSRLIGFYAFDPRRLRVWKDNLEQALKLGFLGVKFYPPMGYVAAHNNYDAIETCKTVQNSAEQKKIDKCTDDFFKYCEDERIPVFTHCTPSGAEACNGAGWNSHPKYWKLRLLKNPNLILCLGHAGGGKQGTSFGWYADPKNQSEWNSNDNFARHVVDLCKRYKYVYCEFAYIEEMMFNAGLSKRFKANLIAALSPSSTDKYKLENKIMFGTDWYMPMMIDSAETYLKLFLEFFRDPNLIHHKDNFFWNNALTYLNIKKYYERLKTLADVPQEVLDYADALRRKIEGLHP